MRNIVIFDLDGTLLYTLKDLQISTNYALNTFNYPPKTISEIRSFVGNGVAKLIERAIPNGKDNPDYQKVLKVFKTHYKNNMYNKTKPYDGITDLLEKLKKDGYKIAVASNKFDSAVKELCNNYFDNLIDFSIGENEKTGIRKKPNPDEINKVLEYFNATSDNAIYIGDSEVDIQTAQNSNLACISVLWGYKDADFLKTHGAKIFAKTPQELYNLIIGF